MNENTKTGIFVGLALVAGVLALVSRPASFENQARVESTGKFFPNFTDPLAATSLEIIKYDQDTGAVQPFKVAQVNGVWSLPSKLDYPADAEKQLAQAAADIIDVEKLGVASESPGDHELYGVLDPQDAESGATGVATRVTFADAEGKTLGQLLIGKEVKDKPELRYVRVPRQDVVYEAKVSLGKLSTRFEDWIEKDLLKLSGFDIREVVLDNYSIDEVNRRIVEGDLLDLKYDDQKAQWSLPGLTETEELVTAKLNDLKNALDDLKIVDVRRKPAGLSQDLKQAEGLTIDTQALLSLQEKGFFVAQDQLRSNEGDVVVRTKDGIEYMLRFGEIATDTEQSQESEKAAEKAADEAAATGVPAAPGSNRYLFVTARFNKDLIPPPELKPLPEASAGPAPPAEGQAEAAEKPPAEAAADPAAQATEKAAEKAVETERQKIETENKRLQAEYDKKLADGEKRVAELNARFADWYYVISDEVFKKIHLARADIVGPKGEKKEGEGAQPSPNTVDELEKLNEGLPESSAGPPTEPAAEPTGEPNADEAGTPAGEAAEPAPPATEPAPEAGAAETPPAEPAPTPEAGADEATETPSEPPSDDTSAEGGDAAAEGNTNPE